MAYTHNVSGDRPSKIKSELRGLATVNNAQTSINELPTLHFYELEPAEVIDIIIDDSHPDFKTYEDIGKVKVRLLYSGPQDDVDGSKCPWAKSLDSNIKNFPLKHEIVITGHYIALEATAEISEFADPITAPKVLYYFSRLNTLNSVNHNAMLNISFIKAEERGGNYDETETGNANKNENKELELGDTFKDDNNIHPLKYYEGDIIYEGRTGQSIRFGSTDASGKDPTLKIRVGQNPDETDEQLKPIDEDINKDLNSIWITTKKEIPLEIASKNQDSWEGSAPNTYDGAQIILNSDRIIFNSKENEFLVFAKKNIGFSTTGQFLIDSDKETIINCKELKLGIKAEESLVLGDTLKEILEALIDAIVQETHPTGTGPSGPPINAAAFNKVKQDLKNMLSKKHFVE